LEGIVTGTVLFLPMIRGHATAHSNDTLQKQGDE
jgi:hypothetical protein